MQPQRIAAAIAALLAALFVPLGSGSCSRSTVPRQDDAGNASGVRSAPVGDTASRPVGSLDVTRAPTLAFRQLELPPGVEISDRTEDIAAFSRYDPNYPHPLLGLLDLRSGAHRIVLHKGLNESSGYSVIAPRISDSWIAWEETSLNEANEPAKAQWRLYAAPIDRTRLSVGTPVLVDSGETRDRVRPFYSVLGSRVFWTVNRRATPEQPQAPFGTIESMDLATGRRRTVARAKPGYVAMCMTEGLISVTTPLGASSSITLEGGADSSATGSRAQLIDPVSGSTLESYVLTQAPLAHYVRAAEGWLSWAAFPSSDAEWPTLYSAARHCDAARLDSALGASPAAAVIVAGTDSIDPAFFGDYAAFESVDPRSTGFGPRAPGQLRRIWLADLAHRWKAPLLETSDGTEQGWWQTCAGATRTDTLLVWNDLGPWMADQSKAKTLVRLYRAGPQSEARRDPFYRRFAPVPRFAPLRPFAALPR